MFYNNNFGNYQTQITRVNGECGAKAYQMYPNSSVLLLDENNPIVWLAQTDGAGYKTVTPYKIEKYAPEPTPDMNEIIERIKRIEERLNESYNKRNENTEHKPIHADNKQPEFQTMV